MKIGFLLGEESDSDTLRTFFYYAFFNKETNGGESLIFVSDQRSSSFDSLLAKTNFSSYFLVFEYRDLDELHSLLKRENVYCLLKSSDLKGIVSLPSLSSDFRDVLNIPRTAEVFGIYGEADEFNLPFVRDFILESTNKYFLFTSRPSLFKDLVFTNKKILFFDEVIDPRIRTKFINTCDKMLHACHEGKRVNGLSILEFLHQNKEVFLYENTDIDPSIRKLCSLYKTKDDLIKSKTVYPVQKDIHEFLPQNRMKKFPPLLRIKMICNWCSSEQLCKEWSNMCEEGYRWKNFLLTSEDHDIDYYVIINSAPAGVFFDPKRTIIFQMEPWVFDESKRWGVKTWGTWAKPDPRYFLAVRGRNTESHNNAFWQLETPLYKLKEKIKTPKLDKVSSICSSKYFDEGHKLRIDFLKFLEEKGDVPLDIFNSDNQHGFKNYRGPLSPYKDKSEGLIPYKYYFMMENNFERNFITEKLWEPILCETLVFYYGCPNVLDYVNKDAFVLLDPSDFQTSYETIKRAIEEDWWSKRIDSIRKEKRRILEELAFFPTIQNIISTTRGEIKEKYDLIYSRNHIERTDREIYDRYFGEFKDQKMQTVCFIYSCNVCGDIKGEKVLKKLLDKVLTAPFDRIFILNTGYNISISRDDRIKIINYSPETNVWETPALNLLHAFSQFNDSKVFYCHTKGITYKLENNDPRYWPVQDWIDIMLYFNIEKVDECLELLNQTDTAGCIYYGSKIPYYCGNFWWANTKYLRQLEKIKTADKMFAELWIFSNVDIPATGVELCEERWNVDHFWNRIPREVYTNWKKKFIFVTDNGREKQKQK